MKEAITISKEEYDELIEDSKFLSFLVGAGVDNWDGYDDARKMMEEDDEKYEEE